MKEGARDSFIRWQAVTRDYFTAVSNLVLGLSTGLLAFLSVKLFSECSSHSNGWMDTFGTISVSLLAISVALAVGCAINRLYDFRLTAQIARKRWQTGATNEDRTETEILGKRSWRLFYWQLGLFAGGAITAAVSIALSFWQ